MINNYEKIILNKLIDKFEKSKSFIGKNKVSQRFKVSIATLFPAYEDHAKYDIFQDINEAIDILIRKDFISGKANAARVIKDVTLQTDRIDEVYDYLGRTPKYKINNRLRDLLESYVSENEILRRYCSEQLLGLSENRSVKFFSGDFNEYKHILDAVKALVKVDTEQFIREFSIQVFKDSKVFLGIQNKVENLLFEYGDFPEKEDILGHFNLVRTPAYVNFKGAGKIQLSGEKINLMNLSSDIAISSKMLDDITLIKVLGNKVMTVENLTSFHAFNEADYLVIYLGGFHNTVRKEFIKRLYSQNPHAAYFHFGDVDAGGFYILEHLKKNTEVYFKPYRMDIETLKRYQDYLKPLTENDKNRLKRLISTEHSETIQYMLENNCKLEQEAVNYYI